MSRLLRSKAVGAAAVAPETKTIAQLQAEVKLRERAIEDRKLLFLDLCEQSGAPAALGRQDDRMAPSDDPVAEARRLISRNAFLRDELKAIDAMERQYANDPRVRDKRNEVRLVQMQIAQVEREVDTLQQVKRRRDKGLRAIGRTEERTRCMRGQQHEMNAELREGVRRLMEELRELEKTDMEVRARCARLQDQVKLSVTDTDVQQLRQELQQQSAEIENLASKEALWRKHHASVREEDHRIVAKYRRECAKLTEEAERLQGLLRQKDLELRRSYHLLGRFASVPGLSVVDASGVGDAVGGSLPASEAR
ncbi:hypothetical protein GH5_03957 [Leishmania sp. Ghana 2012 LV757]|uniref:hypothetical protein n=1 Tax=Leishmania sp. Ghana 2012 LV757 TaxID=2803181 RepID=UPI001B4E909D|nr:hypothetical protein GH5_03957 [Leishmania sp. Ghana 2012 LV757]